MTTDPPIPSAATPLNDAGLAPFCVEPKRARGRGLVGWVLFLIFAVMLFMLLRNQGRTFSAIPYSEFNARLNPANAAATTPDRIEWLRLEGDTLYGKFVKVEDVPERGPVTYFRVELPPGMGGHYPFFHEIVERIGLAKFEVEPSNNLVINILLPLIPWLLIFGIVWYFLRPLRHRGAGTRLIVTGPGRWIPDAPATPLRPNEPTT